MSILKLLRILMGKSLLLSALFLLFFSQSAWALNIPISAEFVPNPSNTRVNKFVNLTPNSGYCAREPYTSQCSAAQIFSIRAPLSFSSKSIRRGDNVSIKAPGEWRKVTVTHPVAGPQVVEVRIVGVGSTYRITPGVQTIVGGASETPQRKHSELWGGLQRDWVYVPSPCTYTGSAGVTDRIYLFFWKVNSSSPCSKTAAYDIPDFAFQDIDFGYELRTPNPLAMQSGTYVGSLVYGVGPNSDFDLNQMVPSDGILSLDFSLKVTHALKVEIPPGGNKIELVPEGGWQRWMNGNNAPSRLFRDQPFLISASTPFKMYVECEGVSASYCNLYDPARTSSVPVQVSVTLPNGFSDSAGARINKRVLNNIQGISAASAGNALQVNPGFYVDRSPAILHFEVPKEGINEVLKKDGPSRYNGKITIMWDAEI